MKPSRKHGKREASFGWTFPSVSDSHRLIAIYRLFGGDHRLLRFLFDSRSPRLRLAPDMLLGEAAGLGHGERLLIQAGIELWSGGGRLDLADAIQTWDSENLTRFIRAICHLAEIRNPVMHALIDDENCDAIHL